MVFDRNFCKKRRIWVSEPHLGEVSAFPHFDTIPECDRQTDRWDRYAVAYTMLAKLALRPWQS